MNYQFFVCFFAKNIFVVDFFEMILYYILGEFKVAHKDKAVACTQTPTNIEVFSNVGLIHK